MFNGVFKRVYRSMRSEFRKLYKLNSLYLDDESYFSYQDSDIKVLRLDYQGDPKDLIPAADSNAFSNKEKAQKAQMVLERSGMTAGYDPVVVEKRWLSAMEVPDVDELFPMIEEKDQEGNPTGNMVLKFPPQPNPEIELQKAELEIKAQLGKSDHDIKVGNLEIQSMLAEAKVLQMVAQAEAAQDKTLVDKLKAQLSDMISKRNSLTAVAVAEINAEKAIAVAKIGAKKVEKGTSK